jgi:hypothetical protein
MAERRESVPERVRRRRRSDEDGFGELRLVCFTPFVH